MSVHASRTAEPLPDKGRGAPVGTWGLLIGMIAISMFVAGLAAAALYLQTGQEVWPPDGIVRPSPVRAMVALATAASGVVAAQVALGRLRQDDPRGGAVASVVALTALTAACVLLVVDLGGLSFRRDVHAYASIYWILTAASTAFLALGGVAVGVVFLQMLVGLVDRDRHLELSVTVLWLWYALAVSLVLLGLVHGLPRVAGSGL